MEKIKTELVDLLINDKDVQKAIQKIISSAPSLDETEKIDDLEKKLIDSEKNKHERLQVEIDKSKEIIKEKEKRNDSLLKQLHESEEMFNRLKNILGLTERNNNKELQSVIEDKIRIIEEEKALNTDLQQQISSCQTEINAYKDNFSEELLIFDKFNNLSKQTSSSLSNIFKDDLLAGFMACGVQEKNINNLWEYIKNEDIENKNTDLPALKQIFGFLFTRYLIAYPMYEKQQVAVGDAFDSQQHIKHSSSQNVSGEIQRVSFYGWINKKNNKVIKKSVVII